jgi:hypothetical protein
MIEVASNTDTQRLYVTADQALSPEDVQGIIRAIQTEAGKLQPGFAVAVDFRGMWVNDSYLNERIKVLQEALLTCGARKIGTLLDNPSVQMRLSQEGLKTRSNEITRRFYDEQEWEAYLAQT